MSIQVGTQIPQFELLLAGRPYRAAPGKRGQLLYFMRTADCPVCRAHVKRLIAIAPQLEASGLNILVIVPEGDSEGQVAQTLKTPFPVVQGIAAHSSFGLHRKLLSLVQESGTVVYDAAGLVVHARSAINPSNAFDEDAVLELKV